ncbi:MAG TPA: M56 family metallopeptidase [Terracidiphilus sp.]|nr:M56 family metallopeptidase [Terracidiphilus sp.]
MTSDLLRALGNHLWQTTLFSVCAAAVALLMRGAPARARAWVWLAATLKFLVPFSLLLAAGSWIAPARSGNAALEPVPYYTVDVASQPFTFPPAISRPVATSLRGSAETHRLLQGVFIVWLLGALVVAGAWAAQWLRIAGVLRRAERATEGIELAVLRRVEAAMGMRRPVELFLSQATLEPGMVGIRRPKLVWPRGISGKLSAEQMEAIVAHELTHVRRRDNLTAALHMTVKALFWFHPLVWWLQERMIVERELACDEAVVLGGSEPEVYAEGILRACRFTIESPLPCVAGISGAELKQRVRRIMTESPRELGRAPRALLGGLGAAAILIPVIFGFVDAPRVSAQLQDSATPRYSFEVATVKPGDPGSQQRMLWLGPGKLTVKNMPLKELIMFAYNAKSASQISGLPEWANSTTYTIDAKEDEATAKVVDNLPRDERNQQTRLMLQALLVDRFHLKVSHVEKELPVYALVVAKGGPKLKASAPDPPEQANAPAPSPGDLPKMRNRMMMGPGNVDAAGISMEDFASGVLSRLPETGDRVVVDKTGLTGKYDFDLKWTPESAPRPGTAEADNGTADVNTPGLFTALEEQLGLKLESQKGSVATLVVDSVDRPTPN